MEFKKNEESRRSLGKSTFPIYRLCCFGFMMRTKSIVQNKGKNVLDFLEAILKK
jgi:hypothetical protein